MRKIIETTSTLVLWAVWIIGSAVAIYDFVTNPDVSEGILNHLSLVAWAPFLAACFLGLMLIAVRYSKTSAQKKSIPCEHAIQWSVADSMKAQNGKVVDLYFENAGLSCQVVSRHQAAVVLHNENQIAHTTLVPTLKPAENTSWVWKKILVRSLILILTVVPQVFSAIWV